MSSENLPQPVSAAGFETDANFERLFRQYQSRLIALVRSRLSRRLAKRVEADDIVLSAYRSFFVAMRKGVARQADADLWPLLVTITLRKLAHQARDHQAARRTFSREQQLDSAWMQSVLSSDPAPDHAAMLSDEIERILSQQSPRDREILVRTLQGQSKQEIASSLQVHERTVRRVQAKLREALSQCRPSLLEETFPHEARDDNRDSHFHAVPKQSLAATDNGLQDKSRTEVTSHLPPLTYDQFLLKQLIGSGAFSKVYRAIDRRTNQVVAVKFLRKDCWSDVRAEAAMIREFELLSQFTHPHILAMRGWGRTRRGVIFLVTDYVPGINLERWRSQAGPQGPAVSQIVSAAICVTEAIVAAHAQGVLHCDLKPSNVLLREDGQIILCDFGLARWVQAPDDVPRGGTAGFLCPEQISDTFGQITERSDIYGLGGLMYSLLTGHPPMQGQDLPETLSNVLSLKTPPPPDHFRTELSPQLRNVVMKCLRKEPAERFATAEELLKELKGLDLSE